MRNFTEKHERILLYVRELIDGALDQFSHAEVAIACQVGVGTVKDALKRAQGIGLLDWQAQYRPGPGGSCRRSINRYQLLMPQRPPEPRPDLRRRSSLVSKPVREERGVVRFLPSCSPHSSELSTRPLPGFAARFAAKLAEEKRLAAARFWRGAPP